MIFCSEIFNGSICSKKTNLIRCSGSKKMIISHGKSKGRYPEIKARFIEQGLEMIIRR